MPVSRGGHAARRGPQPGRRIIEFRLREGVAVEAIPPATSTWPLGRSVAVCMSFAVAMLPVAVHSPVAGS